MAELFFWGTGRRKSATARVRICKGEGKIDEAISRFSNLVKNDQRNSRLYIDLAECYLAVNKKDEAIKTLENYMRIDGRNFAVRNLHAKLTRS